MPADPASDAEIVIFVIEDEAGIERRLLSPHRAVEQEAGGDHRVHFRNLTGRTVLWHLTATRSHVTQEMAVRAFVLNNVPLKGVKHPRHGCHNAGTAAERRPQLEGTVGRNCHIIVHEKNQVVPGGSEAGIASRCRSVILDQPHDLNLWITLLYQSSTVVGRPIVN
jgi:hypothetical protein